MRETGLAHQAYVTIKNMIVGSELKPGQFINESQMMERLQMGRTPVHEALLELSKDQLVKIHPRKGIEICQVSLKKIHDIFEIREIIEPSILRRTMEVLDKEKLIHMRDRFLVTMDCTALETKEGIFNCVKLDDEFHRFLISPLNNKYAEEMMDSFFDYLTMIRITVTSDAVRYPQSNTEHVELIDAILQGDREKACQKLQEHLDTAYRVTIRNFGK